MSRRGTILLACAVALAGLGLLAQVSIGTGGKSVPAAHETAAKTLGNTAALPAEKAAAPLPKAAPASPAAQAVAAPVRAPVRAPVAAAASASTKPRWKKKLIPFGPKRRREMAD